MKTKFSYLFLIITIFCLISCNKEELDESKSINSRALSDRYYHGEISINNLRFPIDIYWDEEFNADKCFAIAQGTIDLTRHPTPPYGYLEEITLYHVSTKESHSSVPTLYFVMRCNLGGRYTFSSNSFQKRVELIIKFNVESLQLENTITVFEDGFWRPTDFE